VKIVSMAPLALASSVKLRTVEGVLMKRPCVVLIVDVVFASIRLLSW
jgi:hypothetical protein